MAHERHSKETRDRILTVAQELFLEHSYRGVSTEEIAKAAGVSKGTVFHHFKSKENLAMQVFYAIFNYEQYANYPQQATTPEGQLKQIIHSMLSFFDQGSRITAFVLDLFTVLSPEKTTMLWKQILKSYDPLVNFFETLGSDDPVMHARIFFALLDGFGLQVYFDPGLLTDEFKENLETSLFMIMKNLLFGDKNE